ncbi:MAG TPA: hypothetical protein VF572_05735 [Candidatus Saccharimonadales bacterium]
MAILLFVTAVAAVAITASASAAKDSYHADKSIPPTPASKVMSSPAGGTDQAAQTSTTAATGTSGQAKPATSVNAQRSTSTPSAPTTAKLTPAPVDRPTPAPAPTPAPVVRCPECGGDPDKTVTRTGALILSAHTFTVAAGSSNSGLLTARSDSGELITVAYPMFKPGSPMVASSGAPGQATYAASQTFGFSVSIGVVPGTYTVTLRASGQNQGAYSADVTLIITPAQ